jgi:hypothetical protein
MTTDLETKSTLIPSDRKEEKYLLEDVYRPPQETMEFIFDIYDKYIKWRALRNQPYKQFNNQTLIDWLDDARKKFWGTMPLSYDAETPAFMMPDTRNQIIAILAKIANLRMKARFDGVEGFDAMKAVVLKDLVEYWKRGANRKLANFWQFLYNVENGTVVVFTAFKNRVRNVKNIKMYDPQSGETKYTEQELDESDVEDEIINLEDLYLPKIWEPDIQKQEEVIVRTLLKWSDFKDAFKGYANVDWVIPGSQFSDASIFADFLSYDVRGGDFVEVLRYFNAPKDQYAIIANGVLLNPLKVKKGKEETEEIAPLPWNHKKLPFSKTIFEPLDANFFYGVPLAHKVKSPQEAVNKMMELLLDRERRAIAAPIITNDPTAEEGLEFKAGRIYQVNTDVNQYKELPISGSGASIWNTINTLQNIIAATGSGGIGAPLLPSRQPKSATEKAQLAQQQRETAGLYYLFYQDLLEQKTWLALKNMIQFYTATKTEKILGSRKFHKILSLSEIDLLEGGIGNRELRITDHPLKPQELYKESYMRSLFKKERVEIIEVTPKALQCLQFDIKITFEMEESPENERLIFLDFITRLINMFGQSGLLSQKKMLYRTIEKFGESVSDFVDEKIVSDYEKERFGFTSEQPQQSQPGQLPEAQGYRGEEGATPMTNMLQRQRGMMYGPQGAGERMENAGVAGTNILRNV